MLTQQKSDSAYTKQFREGSALVRGIMKFCPKCLDGECFHPSAMEYSVFKNTNRFSGGCWVMAGKDCPLGEVDKVLQRMKGFPSACLWPVLSFYENPLFEETPIPKEFRQEFRIEAERAARIYGEIRSYAKARKCKCGEPLAKGRRVCDGCKL